MKQQVVNTLLWMSVLTVVMVCPRITLAELTASVDVRELTTDETVNFTLSTTTGSGDPDFSVLQNDFEILGQSTFSQTQSHNGKIIQNLSWRLQLLPKRKGQLVIPAMTVDGESSKPIVLNITSPRVVTGDDFGDFHVAVSVDNENPYVQSQVIYTIRVYHAKNFLDGSLSAPSAAGLTLEQLGDDRIFQENRNGRAYRVLERKFALFAQNSGELTLPAVVLNANVAADGGSRGFFAPRKPVRRRSQELTLNVLPRPADGGTNWWLPARQIQLDARWDAGVQDYYVGESFTRTILLLADGLDSTQLPEIAPQQSPAYRVYADKPDLQKQATREGLRSRRTEKWAIVPQQPGVLELPAIEVPWFNTRTGQAEVAMLPATTIQVQPARNAVTGEIKPPAADPVTDPPVLNNNAETDDGASNLIAGSAALEEQRRSAATAMAAAARWKWLAMGALAGWVLTVAGIYWSRRQGRSAAYQAPSTESARTYLAELDRTEKRQDTRAFGTALVNWGGNQWPDDPPGSLVALATRVDSDELASSILELDASLYSAQAGAAGKSVDHSATLSSILKQIRRLSDTRPRRKQKKAVVDTQSEALPRL